MFLNIGLQKYRIKLANWQIGKFENWQGCHTSFTY
jgi:hypothetical protein